MVIFEYTTMHHYHSLNCLIYKYIIKQNVYLNSKYEPLDIRSIRLLLISAAYKFLQGI
jgi:hypothetical protein